MTTPQRYKRRHELFAEVCELVPADRAAMLESRCGDDVELRQELEAMLAKDSDAGSSLDHPVMGDNFDLNAEIGGMTRDEQLVGRQINRYHLVRVIASGGMGTVYEARQEEPRRTLAVKVMKRGIISPAALKHFEYESQILAHLHHPGIAHVYEAGRCAECGNVPYFAMELIADGKPITTYANDHNLSTRARLELFGKVCDAVHHGHQKGVIHRDLKPSNILVDADGGPKVIDFGVARATDSDLAVTTLQTDVGQLMGTLQYMSPEQCEANVNELDTRSDVYSLGVVLYELLCDQVPYDVVSGTIPQAIRVIHEQAPPPLSTINRTLRGDLETITLKALEKDKTRRYASAAELEADIGRYLNDEPIVARPASTLYQLRKFAKRNRILVGGIVAVFLALAGGIIATSRLAIIAQNERARAETKAQSLIAASGWPRIVLGGPRIGSFLYDDGQIESLADVLQNSERPEVVEPLLREAIERYEQALREQGMSDAAIQLHLNDPMSRYGVLLLRLGRPAEAVAVFRRVLDSDLLQLDPDYLKINPEAAVLGSIPDEYDYQGVEPADNPDLVGSYGNLAAALRDAGELDEAEWLFLRAIEMAERIWPSGFAETAHVRSGYGACLKKLRRFEEAEANLLGAYGVLSEHEDRPPTTRTLRRIIDLYKAWGKSEDAAAWRAKLPTGGNSMVPDE